ncbi:PadR family transcriptional regulator [Streptomyces paromomycinus]|uniref:PadR family transcriptional regulator n=1 Tax=Streptomyces paromomycinus TaxID=92743 RepID=A0A401W4U6_STREY|nr:PadR family transcriptional regulator [Streptomyces paromomycinus]GCD44339.1 PadR family transcriptional regulator [Streptomyces paromomycinus]
MSLRHAVLGLLAASPASGYDLMKTFDLSLAHVWPATQSQVYGELNKLTAADLIEVASHGPRGRKEYAITKAGMAELHHWLTEVEPVGPQRHDGLLRVFFLGALTPLEARTYLLQQAERSARAHADYRALADAGDWKGEMIAVYGRIALEFGLRQTAMMEEWANWAAAEITSDQARRNREAAGAPAGEQGPDHEPEQDRNRNRDRNRGRESEQEPIQERVQGRERAKKLQR